MYVYIFMYMYIYLCVCVYIYVYVYVQFILQKILCDLKVNQQINKKVLYTDTKTNRYKNK